ncbi:MAG: MoaD/ThiS family protein [Acidobacteria bacterium]|nr:MoaD/ThiS family protein [Acidobacteriota bacterium]
MNLKILFFGATADAAGSREIELQTGGNLTVERLARDLTREYPALSKLKLLIAVNEEYADADGVLTDGDKIAVFTAVSGG